MRTTIELDDRLRAALVKRAAERGEKGYSKLINEALAAYLAEEEQAERDARAERILALGGSISEEVAERLHASVREVRENWGTDFSTPTS